MRWLLLMCLCALTQGEKERQKRDTNSVNIPRKDPKIVTKDGHLYFQSALNHNISLQVDGTGDVNLAGTSLKDLLSTIKNLKTHLSNLQEQVNDDACAKDSSGALCGPNGICVSVPKSASNGTGYKCVCNCGYCGKKCDKPTVINPCQFVRCLNSGTCEKQGGEAICRCTSSWFGPRCELPRPSSCSATFTKNTAVISSPGFPVAYPPNAACTWVIRVQPGLTISMSFAGFNMEDSSNCAKDSLEIRDGARLSDTSLFKKCGYQNLQKPYTSSGNEVLIKFKTDNTGQIGPGFSLSYTAITSAVCGGRITDDSGSITSKNWPLVYDQATTCIWVVDLPKGAIIEAEITQLTISSQGCRSYLELHDGPSDSSPIIGKYCSSPLPAKRVTNDNQLYVKFVSDGSGSKFKLKFNSQCGGNLTSPSGNFQSPYFPNPYPHKKRCVWKITVPPGNFITLTFPTFNIEPTANCIYDYVSVRNGPDETSPYMGRFCGSSPPTPLTSSMNQLTVIFNTDESQTFGGFNASYRSAPGGCGGAVTGNSGNISSPTNALQYPHSVRCIWTITAADKTRSVQLQFTLFDLEVDSRCRYDYVMFRDGAFLTSPVLYNSTAARGRFCGTRKPPIVTSSSESLTLIFITDISIAKVGFSARWITVPQTTGCDVYLGTTTGSIQSPNYPQNYPHLKNCKYSIVVPSGQQIALTFQMFQLEFHSSCNYDSLSIYDGTNTTSPSVGKFCGTRSPGRIVSSGNALYLVFQSDLSSSARGFYANYTAASTHCGGMLHTPTGLMRSPNYPRPYRHDAECEWVISVLTGNTITVNISDLDLERHSSCRYDYLELRDGENRTAPLIARVCSSTLRRRMFKSTSNKIYIKFKSDSSLNGRGFEVTYTSGCGGVLTDLKGYLSSPNYPQSYPNNRMCNWTIRGRAGDKVRLRLLDFRFESGTSCRFDSLTIRNGSSGNAPLLGRYCGTTFPSVITSTVSSMFVQFVSDRSLAYRGFNASYELIGCSADLTADSGNFSTPNYPGKYPHNKQCVWKITVPSGKRIQVNFSSLDLESHVNCNYDHLYIWNGPDKLAPQIGKYCSQNVPFSVTSSSNTLFIEFKSDTSNAGTGFTANYKSVSGGCGGLLTAPSAFIQSPNYPSDYPTNTQCEWTIIVETGHNVRLNFTDFQMEPHSSCQYDYVQIRDGLYNSTELARGCGTNSPGLVVSSGNIMVVKFRSDNSIVHRGFKASYTTGCGGTVSADVAGTISSPSYPRNYPHNSDCVWILRATPGRKVTLTFTNMDVEEHPSCNYDYVEVRQGDNSNSSVIGKYCGTKLPHAITSFGNTLYVRFVSDSSSTRPGFRAEYTSATAACGGTLSALEGLFVSPLFPASTPATADCVWKIKVAPGSKITLSFLIFNLPQSSGCSSSYLQILDGLSSSSRQIAKYCGSIIPATVQSTRENMYVRFYANSAPSTGFRAQFKADCSNTITYTRGYIASPGYPAPYPHNKDCVWRVIVPSGRRIAVTFNAIDLEEHSACNYDYIEARDGSLSSSTRIGRYCGATIPNPFSTTGNSLYLRFHSDYSSGGNGFKLYFDAGPPAPTCGGTFTAKSSLQYITSPNYPNNYPRGFTCTWVINAPIGHTIRLNFTDFELQSGFFFCFADYVELRDGATSVSPYLTRLCGQPSTTFWTSTGSALYIRFRSDGSVTRKGFKASYYMGCGGRLTATTGVIRSPVLNGKYLANQNCTWQISLPAGVAVQLKFGFIDLEQAGNCAKDYVEIRNGIAPDSPVLGRYCGNSVPAVINSTNNQVSVRFVTDGATQLTGFNLTYNRYVKGCGGVVTINDPTVAGVLTSPNYPNNYPNSIECEWVLNVPSTDNVEFTFTNISIEHHSRCQWDYLELRDGGAASSSLIGRYCGDRLPTPYKFITNGSQMYVKLRADATATRKGFRAIWRIGCGKIYSALTGTFTSPGFPNSYPANKDCKYLIHIPANQQIQVTFNSFSIAQSNPCSDFLEIYDGGSVDATRISRLCGNTLPSVFISTTNMVLIRFKSDGSLSGNGFEATYRAIGNTCGGTLTTTAGTITSPNYPAAYPRGRECVWTITVRTGHSISLKFNNFRLPSSRGCATDDYIQVRTGGSPSSPLLGAYCGGSPPPATLKSTGNQMFIRFYSNRDSTQLQGFSASYTSYVEGCGGALVGASGNFTSPNYPSNYPGVAECVWTITVPSGNIHINFTDFEMEFHSRCAFDYVEVRDGASSTAVLIGRLCGTNGLGFNYTSAGRTLYIKFRSDSSIARKGFFAVWTNAGTGAPGCGGRLTAANGVLTSPGYPNPYLSNLNCIWIIEVLAGRFITLNLIDLDLETANPCKDTVTIRNGGSATSPLVVTGCTTPPVTKFTTTGNKIYIRFTTDGSGNGRGFNGTWTTTIPGCGGTSTAPSGTIISPMYPNNYFNNIECEWKIQVPGSSDRIILYFDDFNVQTWFAQSHRCIDYLEIRNGSDRSAVLVAKLCGTSIPAPISSTGNSIYLRFVTDNSGVAKGFKIHYKTGCGGTIKSKTGVIMSPSFPQPYQPSQDCEWSFNVTGHYRLQLTFTTFALQPAASNGVCTADYVDVRNGTTSAAPSLGKFCGSPTIPMLESGDNQMYVKFHSDSSSNSYKGFRASYNSVCGGLITDTNGVLSSTSQTVGNYHHAETCVWIIRFPVGKSVNIRFTKFAIEYHPQCNFDYLEMRDGDNAASPLFGKFCGGISPPSFTSSGNTLYIKLVTDDSVSFGGFSMTYSIAPPRCGGIFTNTTGIISSPNYPGNYSANENCGWSITVPLGKRIELSINDFVLQNPINNGCYDFLELNEGRFPSSPLLGRYCGIRYRKKVMTAGNNLYIRFRSNGVQQYKGFTATYRAVDGCGGLINVTDASEIKTPNYPSDYPANTYCDWLLQARPGYKVQLTFSSFQLPQPDADGKCTSNYVIVRNGAVVGASYGNRIYCGTPSPPIAQYISDRNIIRIVLNSTAAAKGFVASYKEAACGGTYTSSNGMITSPNYPSYYPLDIECVYKITVSPSSNKIQLYFRYFNIEAHASCQYDYLDVRDGATVSSPQIGNQRWCGRNLPPTVVSTGNNLYVHFKTDISVQHSGFLFSYTSSSRGCGGPLSGSTGALTSPGYGSSGYNDTYDCTWIITAESGKRIKLTFPSFHLPYATNCATTDFVEVRDGGTSSSRLVNQYCGNAHPAPFTSAGNNLYIRFKSTLRSLKYTGFQAFYDQQ